MTIDAPNDPRPSDSSDPLAGTTVENYASIGIVSCMPDTSLGEVAWLMTNNRVHAVIVVDDEAPQPPVISDVDLIGAAASGRFDRLSAGDIAGTEALSVHADEELGRAAQLLSEHAVSHLIVRDRRHLPTGIISSLDIARAIAAAPTGSR